MRRLVISATLAAAMAGWVAFAPAAANAFCCPAITNVQFTPVYPPVQPRVNGRVEINECVGLSFLHIVLRSNAPDGTLVMAVIPPTTPRGQPLLSDWISITATRGEIVWQGVTAAGVANGGLTGRTIQIVDSSFTPLAQVKF